MPLHNCSHWYTNCSKCGRRYHICHGTTQCDKCRKPHYEYNWETSKMEFVCYKDTPVTPADGQERYQKWTARQRLIARTEQIRKELGC